MRVPNCEQAQVSKEKIVDYLLSPVHPDGQAKAKFFTHYGFSAAAWQQLALALVDHARDNAVSRVEASPFGVRYIVEGILRTPDGRNPFVRTVWFIEDGETMPRLVTAYPREKG